VQEKITDKQILELFRKEPEEGFRNLVLKYQKKLYYHIRRIVILHEDADDALQNSLIKIWQNLSGFREISSLYTWLYRISTNEALSIIKKRTHASDMNLDSLFASSDEGASWFDGDLAEKMLWEAIANLPEKQRIIFIMKYYDDLKYEEISSILETSVGALKASYHHAVKKIEEYLTSR